MTSAEEAGGTEGSAGRSDETEDLTAPVNNNNNKKKKSWNSQPSTDANRRN